MKYFINDEQTAMIVVDASGDIQHFKSIELSQTVPKTVNERVEEKPSKVQEYLAKKKTRNDLIVKDIKKGDDLKKIASRHDVSLGTVYSIKKGMKSSKSMENILGKKPLVSVSFNEDRPMQLK